MLGNCHQLTITTNEYNLHAARLVQKSINDKIEESTSQLCFLFCYDLLHHPSTYSPLMLRYSVVPTSQISINLSKAVSTAPQSTYIYWSALSCQLIIKSNQCTKIFLSYKILEMAKWTLQRRG